MNTMRNVSRIPDSASHKVFSVGLALVLVLSFSNLTAFTAEDTEVEGPPGVTAETTAVAPVEQADATSEVPQPDATAPAGSTLPPPPQTDLPVSDESAPVELPANDKAAPADPAQTDSAAKADPLPSESQAPANPDEPVATEPTVEEEDTGMAAPAEDPEAEASEKGKTQDPDESATVDSGPRGFNFDGLYLLSATQLNIYNNYVTSPTDIRVVTDGRSGQYAKANYSFKAMPEPGWVFTSAKVVDGSGNPISGATIVGDTVTIPYDPFMGARIDFYFKAQPPTPTYTVTGSIDNGGIAAPASQTIVGALFTSSPIDFTCASGYEIEKAIIKIGSAEPYEDSSMKGRTTWQYPSLTDIQSNISVNVFTKESPDVTLNYAVGVGSGDVSRTSETLAPVTGKAKGSQALPSAGYHFDGWYTDSACTQAVDPSWISDGFLKPAKDSSSIWKDGMVWYVKFTANTDTPYTVTWYGPDGTTLRGPETRYGTTDTQASAAEADKTAFGGYTFNGGDPRNVLSDKLDGGGKTALKLYFAADPARIEFEENGGTAVPDMDGATDEAIVDRTMPTTTREGYTFDGWYDAQGGPAAQLPAKYPAGTTTYYAGWTAKDDAGYYVHYFRQGTADSVAPDKHVTDQIFDGVYTEAALAIVGYTVVPPASQTFVLDEYDKEIAFSYTANTYSIDYAFVSGTGGASLPIEINDFLPPSTSAQQGASVSPGTPSQTSFDTDDGTWTFQAWDADPKTVDGADVIFTGTWTFAEDDPPVPPTPPTPTPAPAPAPTPVSPTPTMPPATAGVPDGLAPLGQPPSAGWAYRLISAGMALAAIAVIGVIIGRRKST